MGKWLKVWFVVVMVMGFMVLTITSGAMARDIRVGAVINLTGPVSTFGQFHAKGHQDYVRYVNEVKGGVYGKKIDLTIVDHAYKPAEGVKYVRKFCAEDKVDMIACWDAGTGLQAKPIFQKYMVPVINYSTAQAFLMPPMDYAYLPFGSYELDSWAILEYIETIHKGPEPPKVGLLTYDNPYGKAVHAPSRDYESKHGIKIVGLEEFSARTVDLTTEMLRLQRAGAEYILMQLLPGTVVNALRAADKINYNPVFIGTWTSTDPDFFKRGKGVIRDRMYMQFCGALPVDETPGVEIMNELMKRYKNVDYYDLSYWEGVVIAMIMERAFERAHEKFGEINSETINKALETFRDEDFGGLVPPVTYTETDHSASWRARIVKVNENRTFTPVTSFWQPGKEKLILVK